ncbi:hypothetical protein ACFLZL_00930 [Thermodesulfobacteriota bacterium]
MDINKVKYNIKEMELIDKKIDKIIKSGGDLEEVFKLIDEYIEVKKEVKSIIANMSVIEITDYYLKDIIKKISSNKPVFKTDIKIRNMSRSVPNFEKLDYGEIDQLSSDIVTSWISSHEIAESLYETKILILGMESPYELKCFVDEARKCLAFQQYNAVYSMCRTIVETSMYDVCIKMGKIDKPKKDSREFYFEYPPKRVRNLSAKGKLKERIIHLYHNTSSMIHGFKTIDKDEAIDALKEAIEIVQNLYGYNQTKFIKT